MVYYNFEYIFVRIDMSGGIEETLLLDKKNDNR
jgi:hypothetical protein